ncbi:MAG: family 43 glycosylhydrolase [Candidatus Limnocylindria bacterium]
MVSLLAVIALAVSAVLALTVAVPRTVLAADSYQNPLLPAIDGGGIVESCADPSVIYSDVDGMWFMYCTKDPLNDDDATFHNIPMYSSPDLVTWTYEGDAFPSDGTGNFPDWAEPTAGLWAPEIDFLDGVWYLYYTVTDPKPDVSGVADCGFDPAIGVATSDSPLGPWTDSGDPVVDPRPGGEGCNFFVTIDAEVFVAQDGGAHYIYFGSYYGGIWGRQLVEEVAGPTSLWTESDPESEFPVTIPNRYEGAEVVFNGGYYYLFVSASNCCNGALTGYSVFAGRSTSPEGPYVDAQGVSLLDARVGGTPVLSMNGNRFVGPGHNTVFQDFAGQWWTIYHAVDMNDPYLQAASDATGDLIMQRPAMLDPLDWTAAGGFPTVRGGCWVSDGPMPAPASQPGDPASGYTPPSCGSVDLSRFELVDELSDEFDGTFGSQWSWIREPDPGTFGVEAGGFRFDTQFADLFGDRNDASVLVEPAPDTEFVVDIRVRLPIPTEGFWHNYRQAGVVIYGGDSGTVGDDDYVRLTHVSIWETRQTEFAKEWSVDVPAFFGSTVVGPPHEWTFLRIHHWTAGGVELYQAYTSQDANADGEPDAWIRGGVWTHELGSRIGLISLGAGSDCDTGCSEVTGPDETSALFDWVHVYALQPPASPTPTPTGAPSTPPASGLPNTSTPENPGDPAVLLYVVAAGLLGTGSAVSLLAAQSLRRPARR